VTANPKLVFAEAPVPDNEILFEGEVQDGIQLQELMALRIAAHAFLHCHLDTVQRIISGIDESGEAAHDGAVRF
jgi:hypothetical protein